MPRPGLQAPVFGIGGASEAQGRQRHVDDLPDGVMTRFTKQQRMAELNQAEDRAGQAPAGADSGRDEAWHVLQAMRERIVQASRSGRKVILHGAGTHAFYGNPCANPCNAPAGASAAAGASGDPAGPEYIDCRSYQGVVQYDPTELVVTVRAGTPLADLEALLATQRQCLAFEPPHFAAGGTVGGMVATGLAGPRRMSVGSVRDFILGTVLLSATGEVMRFGGQVMKNVAGYDMSRLLVGSMGVLGLIAEVSLKVLPLPKADVSLRLSLDAAESIRRCNEWAGKPLPLAATVWHEGALTVRLCGAERAVESAVALLGGSMLPADEATAFWASIRNQNHPFFGSVPLWRLSVPDTTPMLDLPGRQLIEWGGALRWYRPDAAMTEPEAASLARSLREQLDRVGGSATLFRADAAHAGIERFHPLSPASQTIHKRLKHAFDPAGVINPGRLYSWL